MSRTPELLCPAALYGPVAAAGRAGGRMVTRLVRGATVAEAAGELVAVSEHPDAWIVLARMWSHVDTKRPQFHLDRPVHALCGRAGIGDQFFGGDPDCVFERVRRDLLAHAWSFAAIAGSQRYWFVWRAAAQLDFAAAAGTHWPVLDATGPRFSCGGTPKPFADVCHLLRFSLGRQGARWDGTTAGLAHAVATLPGAAVRRALEAGDVDAATRMLTGHGDIVVCSLAEHFLAFGLDDEACRAVEATGVEDPHGIVAQWLAGRGDPRRLVR